MKTYTYVLCSIGKIYDVTKYCIICGLYGCTIMCVNNVQFRPEFIAELKNLF